MAQAPFDYTSYYDNLLSTYRGDKERLLNTIERYHSVAGNPATPPTIKDLETMADDFDKQGPMEITKGLKSGMHSTGAMLSGAVGLAGDAFGSDSVRDWGYDHYQKGMERAAETAPAVSDVRDIDSWSDAAKWFMGTVGQLAPSMAEMAVSSVVGGGVAGIAGKKLAKEAIEKAVKEKIESGIEKEIAEKLVMNQIKKRGRQAGVVLGSAALEGGGNYGEAADAVGIENASPLTAGITGLASAFTELGTPEGRILTGSVKKGAGSFGRRLATKVPGNMLQEGTQEAVQHGLSEINMNLQDPNHETDPGSFLTPFAAGMAAGGPFGVVEAIPGQRNAETGEAADTTDQTEDKPQGLKVSPNQSVDLMAEYSPLKQSVPMQGLQIQRSPMFTASEWESEQPASMGGYGQDSVEPYWGEYSPEYMEQIRQDNLKSAGLIRPDINDTGDALSETDRVIQQLTAKRYAGQLSPAEASTLEFLMSEKRAQQDAAQREADYLDDQGQAQADRLYREEQANRYVASPIGQAGLKEQLYRESVQSTPEARARQGRQDWMDLEDEIDNYPAPEIRGLGSVPNRPELTPSQQHLIMAQQQGDVTPTTYEQPGVQFSPTAEPMGESVVKESLTTEKPVKKETPTVEIPEGVQVASSGRPYKKRGAENAVKRLAKQGVDAEVVPLGGEFYGVRKGETPSYPEQVVQADPPSVETVTPPSQDVAEVASKEPWQMTEEEFFKSQPALFGDEPGNTRESTKQAHRSVVKKALADGKPVPPEVLADYPELTAVNQQAALEAPETAEEQPAPEQSSNLDQAQMEFIEGKVKELGSLEAVEKKYSDDTSVDRYARAFGKGYYNEKAKIEAEQEEAPVSPVEEITDPAPVSPETDGAAVAGSPLNDRDTFTVSRGRIVGPKNTDTEVYTLTFKRGETVKIQKGRPKEFDAPIEGISHARAKVKVRGVWYDFQQIDKAEQPVPPKPPKKERISKTIEKVNKANEPEGGFTEADAAPQPGDPIRTRMSEAESRRDAARDKAKDLRKQYETDRDNAALREEIKAADKEFNRAAQEVKEARSQLREETGAMFSTGEDKASPVTREDLEALPMVKRVSGKEGNYRIHFKDGISVPLKTIEVVGDDAFLISPKGEKLFKRGWYDGKGITITQFGDKHTASHELYHFAEAVELIDTRDKAVLNRAARKAEGTLKTEELAEARARFIEQAMRDREAHRETKVGAILQKLADFFDQLVNVFKRTTRGVVRDFEKGGFKSEEAQESADLAVQYSLVREDVAEAIKSRLNKGYFKGWLEDLTSPSVTDDISPLSRAVSLISSYSRKIPALKRVYDIAEHKQTAKHEIEHDITHTADGVDMMKHLKEFRKKGREAYKKLSKYFDDRDVNQVGYSVKQDPENDSLWVLHNPDGKKTAHTSINPEELWDKARELEAEVYRIKTGDKDAAQALYYSRKLNDAEFTEKYKTLMEYIEVLEANGMPTEVAYNTDDGEVAVDLKLALKLMGDRRGYYMPRIWQEGNFNVFAKKDGEEFNFLEKFDNQTLAKRKKRELEAKGYEVRISASEKPSEELFNALASTSAQESLTNKLLSKMGRTNKVLTLEDLSLHGEWDGDTFILTGAVDLEYNPLLERLGGEKHERMTMRGKKHNWGVEFRFDGKKKGFEKELRDELFKFAGTDTNTPLALAKEFVQEYANVHKARGARQSLIQRSGAKGFDVYKGYEEDLNTRLAKSVRRYAAGKAKQDMALNMLEAINGRDVSWDEFQQITQFDGGFEKWEGAGSKIDRETFDQVKAIEAEKPEYLDYQMFVQNRMIDPAKQRHAYTDAMEFFKHMLRNDEAMDRAVGFLKGVAVLKYLGFRPAAAAVNVTNMVAAVPAVINAETGTSLKKTLKFVRDGMTNYVKYKSGKGTISAEDRKIFEYITRKGWDEAQLNSEALGAIQSRASRVWSGIIDTSMKMFGWTEAMNRGASIYAAFKAQTEGTFDERMKRAQQMSNDAHGVYSRANKPAVMRGGGIGANVMQMAYVFRTFTHNYMVTMLRLGFKEKQAKAACWMAFAPAIFGASSAVGVSAVIQAVGKVMGSDDPEEDFYRMVAENFGATSGKVARFGLPGMVNVDMTGSLRIGLGDLPTDLKSFFGAPGDVVLSVYEGLGEMGRGNVQKGFERIAPNAIGNFSKAQREYSEGVTTRSNAPVFYKDEPLRASEIDAMLRFLSFNPAALSQKKSELWSEKKRNYKYNDMRKEIYDRIRRFMLKKNPKRSEWMEIVAYTQTYNETAPETATQIDLEKSVKRIQKQMRR